MSVNSPTVSARTGFAVTYWIITALLATFVQHPSLSRLITDSLITDYFRTTPHNARSPSAEPPPDANTRK